MDEPEEPINDDDDDDSMGDSDDSCGQDKVPALDGKLQPLDCKQSTMYLRTAYSRLAYML